MATEKGQERTVRSEYRNCRVHSLHWRWISGTELDLRSIQYRLDAVCLILVLV